MEIPTIHGGVVYFIHPWFPWEASKNDPNFMLLMLVLHFCPTSVLNFCSDRNGGHMSPMACCFTDGTLRSATWHFLQLIFRAGYRRMGKLNIIPFVYKYDGSVYDVYSKRNFDKLMAIYAKFIKKVLNTSRKTLICSRGVLMRMKKMYGEGYGALVESLLKDDKIVSLSTEKKSKQFVIQRLTSINGTEETTINGCAIFSTMSAQKSLFS